MRIRKADRAALEAVLSREADMDEVVDEVFSTVVDQLMARDWHVAAMKWGPAVLLFGPYESDAAAVRAMKSAVSPGPEPSEYQIRKMYKIGEIVT